MTLELSPDLLERHYAYAAEVAAREGMVTSEAYAELADVARKRIAVLEAQARPGASDMLNRLMAADFAEINPINGEIRFTKEGEAVIRSRTRQPAVDQD